MEWRVLHHVAVRLVTGWSSASATADGLRVDLKAYGSRGVCAAGTLRSLQSARTYFTAGWCELPPSKLDTVQVGCLGTDAWTGYIDVYLPDGSQHHMP